MNRKQMTKRKKINSWKQQEHILACTAVYSLLARVYCICAFSLMLYNHMAIRCAFVENERYEQYTWMVRRVLVPIVHTRSKQNAH